MKYLALFSLIFSSAAFAGQCPNLEGKYHCLFSDNTYSLLVIENKLVSQPNEEEMMEYSMDYTSVPGEPDVFRANLSGIPDGWGYYNRCANNRLRSAPSDFSSLVEFYLNAEKAFVYTVNGKITMVCPRKLPTI